MQCAKKREGQGNLVPRDNTLRGEAIVQGGQPRFVNNRTPAARPSVRPCVSGVALGVQYLAGFSLISAASAPSPPPPLVRTSAASAVQRITVLDLWD